MPSIALLAPVVIPLATAGAIALCGVADWKIDRIVLAVGSWGAILVLIALWAPVRATQELSLGQLGFGAPLHLRLDGVGFAFALMVMVPSAVLLTLQPRAWQEGTVAALGLAAAVLAVEAGGVLLTALAGGAAATLAVVQLDVEDPRASRPPWGMLLAAWLALSWVGTILQVRGGTADYGAVPVSALTVPVFMVLAAAALAASGLFPWRGWASQLWGRPALRAAGMSVATLYPLGFYLLVRAYDMGDGHYPQFWLQAVLAALGILVAFGAAARAQAATTRREYLGEVIPGLGGFALMGISLGTPLGLVAGLATLVVAAVLAACLPLLPDRAGTASLVAIAAAAGLPPGLAFGVRVIGLEATFEAGNLLGLLGIAGAATWIVSIIGAARAIGLPAGRGHPASETAPRVAMGLAAATVVAGPALGLVLAILAMPALNDVMPAGTGVPAAGVASVVTVSTVLPALALFTPVLLLAVVAYIGAGPPLVRVQARPALFPLPATELFGRVREQLRAATIPDQYRSLVDLRALEAAATRGGPLLWLAALVALAFAVTR
jgi:formate hydrogenlyase subunit 3/multisubunit Na+/H+ antiporter MnhD subunit